MKKFYALFALLLVASMVLGACTAVAPTTTDCARCAAGGHCHRRG